jgi:hypothetical protein
MVGNDRIEALIIATSEIMPPDATHAAVAAGSELTNCRR